ncbi:uncharacterized protein TRAVEDRAFT_99153, partial [Trametes versicolor FP-101664 SS1]|uniref:uncharacterized protein n=1 Tax=Trametes versicolor (strain FP-101664) TaxID=717944 RepID=UPI0004621782
PPVTLGVVLGGHAYVATNAKGEVLHGATRLARMVLTETAYLVWVLRCERVIGERELLPGDLEADYVERRWRQALARRLANDCALTRLRVGAKPALQPSSVEATWAGTLQDEQHLPPDW